MTEAQIPISQKTEVMRRLSHYKFEYAISDKSYGAGLELRLKISHLQSALDNWVDGKSEYCRLY